MPDFTGIKAAAQNMIAASRQLIEAVEAEERASGDTAFDLAMREPATLGAAGVNADTTAAIPSLAARAGSPADAYDPALGATSDQTPAPSAGTASGKKPSGDAKKS